MKMIQREHECGLAAGNLGIKTPAVVVFLLAHGVKSKAILVTRLKTTAPK